MALTYPDFVSATRPPAAEITEAMWWLWLRLKELEPSAELGGFLAWKRGFHATGKYNSDRYPNDYSIRDKANKTGPWWWTKCAAIDWTFPEAQHGDYRRISLYSGRLDRSARDSNDPRLDMAVFEWFGQTDSDSTVEGYNEYREEFATSDSSHLWHIHISFVRSKCGDHWGMWALLTVLMGWSVQQWRDSLVSQQVQPGGEEEDAMKLFYSNGRWTIVASTGQTATVTSQAKGDALAKVFGNAVTLSATEYDSVMETLNALQADSA